MMEWWNNGIMEKWMNKRLEERNDGVVK